MQGNIFRVGERLRSLQKVAKKQEKRESEIAEVAERLRRQAERADEDKNMFDGFRDSFHLQVY